MGRTVSFSRKDAQSYRLEGLEMAKSNIEQKALSLLAALESAGKSVSSVTLDGRRIEVEFSNDESSDQFDGIDMRHDKTSTS